MGAGNERCTGRQEIHWVSQTQIEERDKLNTEKILPIILIDHHMLGTILIMSHLIFTAVLQDGVLPYKQVN